MEKFALRRVGQQAGVVVAEVFAGLDQEAAGPGGRVADGFKRLRGVRNWPLVPAVAILESIYS